MLEAFVVPLPETISPTWPESETIVPSSGAYSLVSWTACSSLCTVSLSLLTAALAEARLASRVAVLMVALEEPEDDPPLVSLVPCVVVVLVLGAVLAGAVLVPCSAWRQPASFSSGRWCLSASCSAGRSCSARWPSAAWRSRASWSSSRRSCRGDPRRARRARAGGLARQRGRGAARRCPCPSRGRAFAVGFFLLGEVGFGGLEGRLRLFERDFGALRVERREQLTLRDLLSLGHVDVGDRSARLEAEVELARGLQVAAARDRGLDDSAADRDRAAVARLAAGGRSYHEAGGCDRTGAESSQ